MSISKVRTRIIDLYRTKEMSQKQIAEELEKHPSIISNLFKYKSKPSLEMVIRILKEHNNLSAEWLMRGTGEMENEHNNVVGEPASEYTKRSEKEEHLEWRLRITEKYCKQLEQHILQHCRHGADKVLANKPKS